MKINKEHRIALAMLLSTAIDKLPYCRDAAWVIKEDECPDQVIGSRGEWWLRSPSQSKDELFVQGLHPEDKDTLSAMRIIAGEYGKRTGIVITFTEAVFTPPEND